MNTLRRASIAIGCLAMLAALAMVAPAPTGAEQTNDTPALIVTPETGIAGHTVKISSEPSGTVPPASPTDPDGTPNPDLPRYCYRFTSENDGYPANAHILLWEPGSDTTGPPDEEFFRSGGPDGDWSITVFDLVEGEYTIEGTCDDEIDYDPSVTPYVTYPRRTFTVGPDPDATTTTTTTTTSTTVPDETTTTTAPDRGFMPPPTPPVDAAPLDLTYVRQGSSLSERLARLREVFRLYETGFEADEDVHVVLYSDPVVLATVRADSDGVVDTMIEIPADTELGEHTLVLFGTSIVKSGALTIEGSEAVTAPDPGATPERTGLPRTGSTGATPWLAGFGAAFVIVGALALSHARRIYVPRHLA